jgi:TRIAD3 protein (E3 ubiquitin-protein ligase RNF216)
MATDSCNGGFSHTQRQNFLDRKLTTALDRLEANHNISLAAMEDLAKCPFCDYAELYPSIEENRIFACVNTECMVRSCRLCQKEDHLPMTCEEFAKENRLSARRTIEEARSEAVIRKCNKCKLLPPILAILLTS